MKKRIVAMLLCLVTLFTMLPLSADAATTTKPKITKQPKDCIVALGETATATVKATGKGLKYRWYFRDPGKEKFSWSKHDTNTMSFTMTEAKDGREIYCKITDKYGNTLKTNTVTCQTEPDAVITEHPESCYYMQLEETITVTVAATGKDLTYQWYYRNPAASKYSKSDNTTDSYTVTMSENRDGRKMYCVITDKYGTTLQTDIITFKTPTVAEITKQPKSARADLGQKASATVTAKGDDLTYRWYYRRVDQDKFYKTNVTSAKYALSMTTKRSGIQAYCVITDRYGNSVQSETITFRANGAFKQSSYKLKLNGSQNLSKQFDFTIDDTFTWKSSNPSVVSVTSKGVVKGLKNGYATITATGKKTGIRATCVVQSGTLKQVALTFDDGPAPATARFLDYLETTDAKVTFFLVANRIKMTKDWTNSVKRMAKQGHEIGYHSYAHQDQVQLTSAKITSDFNKSNKILKSVTGQNFTLWRTPGGNYNQRVLDAVPLPHIMWSSSTADWKTRNADKVYNSILKLARDGQIILLHDLHPTTVDGAIRAMKKLEKEGYEFVTVSELLSRDGTPPEPHKSYTKG